MSCLVKIPKHLPILIFLSLVFFLTTDLSYAQEQEQKQQQKKEEKEKALVRVKTEEILVTATADKEKPLASVSTIEPQIINLFKTSNLSEVLSFAPGAYVTVGGKGEAHVKIRGIDNDKSTLLLDGIPIYEPYYNLYDLKTVPTYDVDTIQVTKGSSSVLYGANTLGGIVEVFTRRPQENALEIESRFSQNSTFNYTATGYYAAPKFALKLSATHDESKGFEIKQAGSAVLLDNSDYKNNFFNGKFYYYPGQNSELLFQASYYDSSYGVPAATEYYSPRHWRFKDWERTTLGLGGTFPLFKTGTIKIRTYYVKFYNILDSYSDPSYAELDWESIYDNYEAGAFILGAFKLHPKNELRFSFTGRLDRVKQKNSEEDPWEFYKHRTYSAGLEDEWELSPKWSLIGGLSLDYLKKQTGGDKTTVNPIAGIRFKPLTNLDFHFSFSRKSRFPSMRSIYSPTSGNPDIKDELGTTLELGTSFSGWINGGLAVFSSKYKDLISVIRQPDGTKKYINIGEASIKGLEIEASKSFGPVSLQLNYTYLDAWNKTEERNLELVPESQLSFIISYFRQDDFSAALWALAASESEILISSNMVTVPSYFTFNLSLEKQLRPGAIFLRIENLFDRDYFTEPGYPASCRRIMAGFRFKAGLK